MSTRTVPGNPHASDGADGKRRREVAAIAGGAALVMIALGATACTATPSGSSSQVSLNGSSRPAALVSSSAAAPATPAAVTSPAAGAPVTVASPVMASMAAGTPGRGGTSSRPATVPATSASRSAPPGSATSAASSAPADPGAGGAPPSSDQPSYAPSTEPAASEPAGGGTLSVSRDCAGQTTVSPLDPYSCTLTASGGAPFYSWVVFINGNIADTVGSLPSGLTASSSGTNFSVFTISGKPESQGTYAFTITVQDQEPSNPPVTASTSFTLTVQ